MEIDLPEVVAEVRAAFELYEKALVSNDVDALNAFFRDDERTVRYGAGENLYGSAEIQSFRAARSPVALGRTISRTVITSYGREFAVASTLLPLASVPLIVTVRVLPSADMTIFAVVVTLPAFLLVSSVVRSSIFLYDRVSDIASPMSG